MIASSELLIRMNLVLLTTNDLQPTTEIKKPCAGFPDTGLVSLTMTCLRYLVINAEQLLQR
jgi:hypothetical protein